MGIKTVIAKLGSMRKPQEFVVYPRKKLSDPITVQSDKAIGRFDPATGKGLLNAVGRHTKYIIHLTPTFGAVVFEFPPEFVAACVAVGQVSPTGMADLI